MTTLSSSITPFLLSSILLPVFLPNQFHNFEDHIYAKDNYQTLYLLCTKT